MLLGRLAVISNGHVLSRHIFATPIDPLSGLIMQDANSDPFTDKAEGIRKAIQLLPDDWWRSGHTIDVLLDWFRRYLIGLFVAVRVDGESQRGMFSGFLLRHRGYLLWLTAGHVIDKLDRILQDDNVSIVTMHWADNFQVEGAESIPVHRRNLARVSYTQFDIDFGFVLVGSLDRENMLRNDRTQIMGSRGWRNIEAAEPEGFYIIGYPEEWTRDEMYRAGQKRAYYRFEADPICLPVSRIPYDQERSGRVFWNDAGAFYGRIEELAEGHTHGLANIEGVSGGPLLSIARTDEGQFRYRLFGVQRSWDSNAHVIRAEPIQRIVALVDATLDELDGDLDKSPGMPD